METTSKNKPRTTSFESFETTGAEMVVVTFVISGWTGAIAEAGVGLESIGLLISG